MTDIKSSPSTGFVMSTADTYAEFQESIEITNLVSEWDSSLSIAGTYTEFQKPIEKSPNDARSYRLLRLNNTLEVLVIHDPEADKSAASMDVHVGYLSDPDNIQGLAHLLEHMLSLGSEKYPRENDYKEFFALHAGMSNATTSAEHTNFFFEVSSDHLEGALDRFSQFFISPLFDDGCKDRAIEVVDSEFKGNLQSDPRRSFHVTKRLASRDHPFWHFGTGNLVTLKEEAEKQGINSREALITFYNKYYSASLMKLAILGRESLDVLSAWAVEKFSDIKNLEISPLSFNPPLTSHEFLRTIYVQPLKDIKELEVHFLLPDHSQHYTSKPLEYINHLINHDGSGSIISLLKKMCWANSLSTRTLPIGGYNLFTINIQLTKEGLIHHEDIVFIIFQYIYMLRQEGYQPYIMEEMASLAALGFRFKEKTRPYSFVESIADNMQKGFAPEWILSAPDLIRDYSPGLVMEYLQKLAIDGWYCCLVAKDMSIVPGGVFSEKEPWYDVQYHVEKISPQLQERLQKLDLNRDLHSDLHPDLHLPIKNIYIPENVETSKAQIPIPLSHPIIIKHTPQVRLWYKKDDTFRVPKVNMKFYMTSPLITYSQLNRVKLFIFRRLVEEALNDDLSSANKAGLAFNFEGAKHGITLVVEGYNDKAHSLLQKVVHTMKTLHIDRDQFVRVKEKLEKDHLNNDHVGSISLAGYFSSLALSEEMGTYIDFLGLLPHVTLESIQLYTCELFERFHIEGLVHGNVDREQAIRAVRIFENEFASSRLLPFELVKFRSIILPAGSHLIYQRDSRDPKNVSSGIEYYIQVGNISDKNCRALAQIAAQIIQEPCFDQLRTVENLGYTVNSGIRRVGESIGIRIAIQSERDPIHLESRIEEFLRARIGEILENMTEEAYSKQTRSAIQRKLEKHKNLKQETQEYWDQITSGYYNFDEKQDDVREIGSITLGMTREFFKSSISPDSPQIRKLSTHIRSCILHPQGLGREGDVLTLREGTVVVVDINAFKANSELSRAPQPSVDLSRYFSPDF
ncbi:Insulinase (Peptidase M16) [Mortierella sp. AM989]|nr:Insulinase (Peptidase M16) [Mortierella sp. AM989]